MGQRATFCCVLAGLMLSAIAAEAVANPLTSYAKSGKKPRSASAFSKPPSSAPSIGRWKPAYTSASGKYIPGHFTGTKGRSLPKMTTGGY